MQMPKYAYIEVWGHIMGSFRYYIDDEKERAAADGAPPTAIYHRNPPGQYGADTRTWEVAEAIANPTTRLVFERHCAERALPVPQWRD